MTTSPRTILRIYFHMTAPDEALYEQLLTVLEGVTPRVQAHPADSSATVDLTGALRYWSRDAEGVAALFVVFGVCGPGGGEGSLPGRGVAFVRVGQPCGRAVWVAIGPAP